ncbi:MAG: hypothetical protein CVU89_12455 [Firmicutes bacterium HGW-Firmicutes-14]|nr:MAG: hypothetical protein CVU89_12455 [Firmicutes bacterium HGW-Firmicutes-14]
MTEILVIVVGLAAVYGFFLGIYFFMYRLNLSAPMRWLGGIAGGTVVGGLMALAAIVLLWPPFSILFSLGMMVLVGAVSVAILAQRKEKDSVGESELLLGKDRTCLTGDRRNEDDVDVCNLSFDLDASPGS